VWRLLTRLEDLVMMPKLLTSWLPRQKSARRPRRGGFRLGIEPLEDRTLFNATLPPDVVVGRTLSAYFTGNVQNNQETITFTVYNEQANPLSGVLLTDTLAPGVAILSATQQPDRSGQNLAWSLGTIQGFDRASVTLTLSLPSPLPAQLDTGAKAFATLDAGMVSNSTPAAVLRVGSADPALLASTPDANTTDPFVQEQAAKLDYDPELIFEFLHDDVGYNSYSGSLRGARGTLWSNAGNALDVASLGVALMRASGIPAQYESGTLSQSQAQQLILSMFPASYQTVGYIPAGTQVSDPANDPQLLAETESHYWFQFDAGSGMKAADPLMAGATVGQTFTTSTGTFTEVPDNWRQKTEVSLTAEIYSQAAAAFGQNPLQDTVVLDQTFNDVDLVGRPLTIGNFVSQSATGATISSVTNTYVPYSDVGDYAFDLSHDVITHGREYQEVLTNFALGSQILTGLSLRMTLRGPQGATQTVERSLVDRIGLENRASGASPTIKVEPLATPILTDLDLTTINVMPGLNDPNMAGALMGSYQSDVQSLSDLPERQDEPPQAVAVERSVLIDTTRLAGFDYLSYSDAMTKATASVSGVSAYSDCPRLILVSTGIQQATASQGASIMLGIDLRRDAVRAIPAPTQSAAAAHSFQVTRGFQETTLENDVGSQLTSQNGVLSQGISTATVMDATANQNIPLVFLTQDTESDLDSLRIPSEAKARIMQTLAAGKAVLVPSQGVTLAGVTTTAWYEIDLSSGDTIGVLQDGTHGWGDAIVLLTAGSLIEFLAGRSWANSIDSAKKSAQAFQEKAANIAARFSVATFATREDKLNAYEAALKQLQAVNAEAVVTQQSRFSGFGADLVFNAKFRLAYNDALYMLDTALAKDPPLGEIELHPGNPSPSSSSSLVQAGATRSGGSATRRGPSLELGVSGQTTATWDATSSTVQAASLSSSSATIATPSGNRIGSGAAALAGGMVAELLIVGGSAYSVTGTGNLSFYGAAESTLGVSGHWDNYTAAITGNVSIALTVPAGALTLDGQPLPAGTYTIITNSATLSGSGNTTSPNFAGSVSITATNGTVNLGSGSGNVTVGGNSLDLSSGATLTGYTGSITIAAGGGNNTDDVTLDGNAANVLTVSATPNTLTTDQNTPVTFQANVNTSFADTYNFTAQAPPGWTVAIDANGNVIATPAPGLQGGTYPIRVVAQSTTNPDLVAQTTVNVTITPTQPGMTFAVNADPIFTVPYNGAQVPTAFQAVIHNTGPAADTYNLTFSNIPAGWTILNSGTSVTVPAGQTGILGVYLQPTGSLPAPGTPISFTVTATSTSDPTITATQTVSFAMPVVHAITVTTPAPQDLLPGQEWGFSITVQNVGNVTELVHPTAAIPADLNLPGGFFNFSDATLTPGQSVVETDTRTVGASVALNSTYTVAATVSYGPADSPLIQTVQFPVQIVLAGTQYVGNLGVTAGQLGRTDLADRLGDLASALTNLALDPTNAVYKSEALADLDSIIGQLADDPFLAGSVPNLSAARSVLASASTLDQIQYAANVIGGDLNFAWVLPDEAKHSFTLSLLPNTAVAQPGAPVYYNLAIQNTGTQTTTYDFVVYNPLAGFQFTFSQPSITLQPGQAIAGGPNGVTLAVTETGNALVAAGFSVTAVAEGAGEIALSAPATVTLRPAFVSVPEVDATPPFTAPGNPVDVSARVLNAVNEQRPALASYVVTNANGNVVFTSQPVPLTLTVQTSLVTVDLGSFDTTSLTPGSYSLTVTVTDTSGNLIPGATGQGTVFIGSPVTASLSVNPTTLLPGTRTVTNTVQVTAQTPFPTPLTLLGQVQTTPSGGSVALDGNLAYVAGTNGIDVVDVRDPASPTVVNTFAGDQIVKGGFTVVRRAGNELIVGSTQTLNANGVNLLIYSLADPLHPALVSHTLINYGFMSDLLVQGNTVLVPTDGVVTFSLADIIVNQIGSVLSIDVSNPAAPALAGVLFNNEGPPHGGDTNQNGGVIVNDHVAYFASTTSTGGNTQTGIGRVLVVDYSNPANLSVLGEVDVPGTVQVLGVAVQGNRALVVGSSGGWRTPYKNDGSDFGLTGNLTLSVLDVSDPAHPQLLGATLVTDATPGDYKADALPLGNGRFAVPGGLVNGQPVLLCVDPSDPGNIVITSTVLPGAVVQMAVSGNLLYTASSAGLGIYQIGSLVGEPVTVSVQVPTNTGVAVVPGSFNIPPTQILHGAGSDTLVWDRVLAFGESQPTFTWQSTVSNLLPGEARGVTLGGIVNYVNQTAAGTVTLAPTAVSGVHFISLDPPSQTVRSGETATFHVRLTNPSSLNETFGLAVKGVPASWIHVPAAVGIVGGGSADVELQFTPNVSADLGNYGFQVTASYGFGDPNVINPGSDSVQADLAVAGHADVPSYLDAHGVVVTLTPARATAGQGTLAGDVVRLINTGSAVETFALAAALPSGVTGAFSQNVIDVPPGVSNFRDVTLTLTPAPGTAVGDVPFTVTATSTTTPATATATGTLTVVGNGVAVTLDRSTGNPGDTFQVTVTNTGSITDTFDLAVAGPAGLVASLATSTVTLDPGQSQTIPVTTGGVTFAVPGVLNLVVSARSEGNPAVQASAAAVLQIAPTVGLTASLDPVVRVLPVPGTADFLLQVNNTGNTEDAYSAAITGTTGPVTASLGGLDGQPTLTIPIFRLPGLSSGAILIHADLTVGGLGTVSVLIQSLNDPSRTAAVTATLSAPVPPSPPVPPASPTPLVSLTSDQPTASFGQPVTFAATVQPVAGLGTPSGSVTFFDGTTTLGQVALDNGTAMLTTRGLAAGSHVVTAVYGGDATYVSATSSPLAETVLASRAGRGQIYAVGAGPGGGPRVQVYDAITNAKKFDFFAFDTGMRSGVSVATGDVTGDGVEDVITGAGFGGGANVKVFDGSTGHLVASWFAYGPSFRGGVWIAAADLFGDGQSEIVTGPGVGGGPLVEVWELAGGSPTLVKSFLAYEPGFRGGVTVATGLGAGGVPVIAVGAGPGGGPRVRTFDAVTGAILADVFVFEPSFAGGVYVTSGDVLGTGTRTQILVGPGAGGGPRLVLLGMDGSVEGNVFAATSDLRNGLTVAAVDQPSGPAAVLVGAGEGAFRGALSGGSFVGAARVGFFEDTFDGGVFVG
jgi:uncharacterized membrane protein